MPSNVQVICSWLRNVLVNADKTKLSLNSTHAVQTNFCYVVVLVNQKISVFLLYLNEGIRSQFYYVVIIIAKTLNSCLSSVLELLVPCNKDYQS